MQLLLIGIGLMVGLAIFIPPMYEAGGILHHIAIWVGSIVGFGAVGLIAQGYELLPYERRERLKKDMEWYENQKEEKEEFGLGD